MSVPTIPYYPITHDDGLDIINALNDLTEAESSPSLIAEDFDETKSYAVGDYVIYSTLLYRFITPHSVGAWNENHVIQVKVGEELKDLSKNQNSIESSLAIVANGNAHPLIYPGEYVYVKMHDILSEGLYTANSTIVETDDLTTSNLSSVSKGGMNSIAERGTDLLRGNYIKFNNGLAVVWMTISYNHPADIQWGSMYVTDFWDINSNGFPFTFSSLPKIFFTEVFKSTSGIILDIKDTTVSSWGKLRCARPNNATINCDFDCFAIGFWK